MQISAVVCSCPQQSVNHSPTAFHSIELASSLAPQHPPLSTFATLAIYPSRTRAPLFINEGANAGWKFIDLSQEDRPPLTPPACVWGAPEGNLEGAPEPWDTENVHALPLEWANRIPDGAFKASTLVRSVFVPHRITAIGDGAFEMCSNLQILLLPPSLRSVDDCAFADCRRLRVVWLPPSVASLGRNAFQRCSWLAEVTLPPTLHAIHHFTFYHCLSLIHI